MGECGLQGEQGTQGVPGVNRTDAITRAYVILFKQNFVKVWKWWSASILLQKTLRSPPFFSPIENSSITI